MTNKDLDWMFMQIINYHWNKENNCIFQTNVTVAQYFQFAEYKLDTPTMLFVYFSAPVLNCVREKSAEYTSRVPLWKIAAGKLK